MEKNLQCICATLNDARERALKIVAARAQEKGAKKPVEAKPRAEKAKVVVPVAKTEAPKPEAKPVQSAKSSEELAETLVSAVMGKPTAELRDDSAEIKEVEDREAAELKAAAELAKLTVEEFQAKPENIQRHYLRQVRAVKAPKSSKKAEKPSKKTEVKGQQSLADQLQALQAGNGENQ